ncbi:hydrolase [Aureococcus anophagefferens]|nr:hydrolase [Aureococcus anophagefferens]
MDSDAAPSKQADSPSKSTAAAPSKQADSPSKSAPTAKPTDSPPAKKEATKKKAAGAWTSTVKKSLARAEAAARDALAENDASTARVEAVLCGLDEWPTQARPNVSPNEKPVTGMCLGAVNVLGGVGMQVSALPGFPFSSLQINYNYAAKKHVDGNNIGPSYIVSLGDHEGGGLWVADTFVEKATDDGGTVLRGGGGEAVVDHSSYNKLDAETAADMAALGFTAGSSDGAELDYFKPFRIDKSELAGDALDSYLELRAARKAARPPPTGAGAVGIECNGYSAGKGAGWFSFVGGQAAKKRRIDAFFKPKNAAPKPAGPVTYELPKATNKVSTNLEQPATIDGDNVVRVELPKNRVGLWYLELDPKPSGALQCCALERFDLYNDATFVQSDAFHAHVAALPPGRVVLISITDTAMAKTRPLPKKVYDTLRLLGAPDHIEPIGYRMPFAFIGARGAAPGAASLALDKTKVILRLEASAKRDGDGAVVIADQNEERTDITEPVLTSGAPADAAPATE